MNFLRSYDNDVMNTFLQMNDSTWKTNLMLFFIEYNQLAFQSQ